MEDTEAVEESDMLPFNPIHNDDDFPLYVTASVINNRNRVLDAFTIGDNLDTTDPVTGRHYFNAPLDKGRTYYYFIRAYSEAHTRQVCLHLCSVHHVLCCCCFNFSILCLAPVKYLHQLVSCVLHKMPFNIKACTVYCFS